MRNNNRRRNFNAPVQARTKTCSCGKVAKLISRTNYPFGKKSKGIVTTFYRCPDCNKTILA